MLTSQPVQELPISEGRRIALERIGEHPDGRMAAAFWRMAGGASGPAGAGITVFYCILQAGEHKYTLLEFVSGQTLEQLYMAGNLSDCERVLPLFSRLLDGRESLSTKGRRTGLWPRRASSPDTVHLSDFGIVRARGGSSDKLYGSVMFGPDGSWSEESLGVGAGRSTVYPLLMAVYTELRGDVPAGIALIPAYLEAFTRRSLQPPTAAQIVRRRALPYAVALGGSMLLLAAFSWIGTFLAKPATGIVKLEIKIAEDGSARLSKVLEGDSKLAEAAGNAVRKWVYKPAEVNGKPVPATAVVDVRLDPARIR